MSARTTVLAAMRRLGLIRLWHCAQRGKIPILMFHGVVAADDDEACSPLRRRLSARDLATHVRTLSRYFHFVSLADAVDMLRGRRPMRPHSLVLTFDDGYLNNALVAWPILAKCGAAATFFVPTGQVGTGRHFWRDRLDYAIGHLRPGVQWLTVGGVRYRVPVGGRAPLRGLFWQLLRACNGLGWNRAEEAADAIEQLATSRLAEEPQNDHWAGFMTWEHVRSMHREGADFGSHTISHHPLDELSSHDVKRQLEDSKRRLESEIGAPCLAVAYPNGRVTADVARMARRAGYHCGLTTAAGLARPGDAPAMLPRLSVPRRPVVSAELLARATGLSQQLSRLRRWPGFLPTTAAGPPAQDKATMAR